MVVEIRRAGFARGAWAWALSLALTTLVLCVPASAQVAQDAPPATPAAPPASPAPAPAQEGAPQAPAEAGKPPALEPPKLVTFVQAEYPPEAAEQGLQARVIIELTILPDGSTKDLKVVEPVGHGFDEAALAAVKQFVFEPAKKDGKPIGARIRYPYLFEITVEEVEPDPEGPPPPAALEGVVLSAERDRPLAGAEVIISTEDGSQSYRAETDTEGKFSFKDLDAGLWIVRVSREDKDPSDLEEELRPGELNEVVYRLSEPPDPEAFGAVARVPPPPREVTRRTIGKKQLTRIPGTRGDALRTVELMPGVARPPLGAGVLIVRGSAPADTQALFEGIPVQLIYHFGGLTSFVNSRMLESIEFYPGNFSVRYGRRRGGVIEVRAAELPRDELHAVADVNLIDASLLVQTPISEDAEIAIAGRRSYFDILFESALESADVSTVAAPVYYDYQLITTYRPGNRDRLRLMLYGSSDEFRLLFDEPNDNDSAVSGDFDFGTVFHRGQGSWRRKLTDRLDQELEVAVGTVDVDFGLGEVFDFNLSGTDIYARSEWRGRVTDKVHLNGGLDLFFFPGKFTYTGPPVESSEGNPDMNASGATISNLDTITASDDFTLVQPAVYLESALILYPLRVVFGSRIDYFDEIEEFTFDPRVSSHLSITEDTKLKAGLGIFSQPPEFQESSPALGNPDLEASNSVHATLGADQEVVEGFSLSLDGFYKHIFKRVVSTEFGEPPFFTNDGQGRVYGLEVSGKIVPKGRFFGYVSYTLSRSERKDREGAPWRLFDFDQTHILTTSAVVRVGRGWEVGGTFRIVSGNPDTPVVGSSLNTITGLYSPLFGRTNSVRSPMFNRLDVRVEKLWKFPDWKLALYLDLQNAYNADNPEGRIYDFEYRERQDIRGLPIIPNLGIRGEM